MSCYDVFVRWKQAYPLSVILVQVRSKGAAACTLRRPCPGSG